MMSTLHVYIPVLLLIVPVVCLENFLKYCGAEYNILSICRKNLFKKQVNMREYFSSNVTALGGNLIGVELIELA